VCITEWSGGERIEIPVVVVGTLPASQPGRRAILVKLDDPRFADAGVVAGMSGSPVYVDGKLLGAVAFGWNFAREPLAGVTPFEDMQAIPVDAENPGSARRSLSSVAENPLIQRFLGADGRERQNAFAALFSALRGDLELASLAPIPPPSPHLLPLATAGFPDSPWAEKLWRPLGLAPVPGGAVTLPDATLPEAGDMVAAVLIWGDAVLAAGGTLTASDGDTYYAFGHPLFAAGPVKMPAARAKVLAIQSNYALPFKIFTVGQPFGTFLADQPAGMVAVAGKPPAGLPVTVEVVSNQESKRFSFYLADIPLLQPLLAAFLAATSLSYNQGPNADLTVDMTVKAGFADGSTVSLRQNTAGADAVGRVATFLGALVGLFTNPPFPAPPLTALDVELSRSPHVSATILEAIPQRRKVRPGEALSVAVRLQPYRGPAETRVYSIEIPKGLPPGKLDVIVADGASFSDYALRSEKAHAENFHQLCAQLSRLEPSSHLVAALETREAGLSLPQGPLSGLPPSLSASYAAALTQGNVERLTTHLLTSQRWPYPWPLAGGIRVSLDVVLEEAP
ncbi:MAG: SpoIVB peptidase S55 domain-containing protein, partial [Thermoanaerobaculum sp.]